MTHADLIARLREGEHGNVGARRLMEKAADALEAMDRELNQERLLHASNLSRALGLLDGLSSSDAYLESQLSKLEARAAIGEKP